MIIGDLKHRPCTWYKDETCLKKEVFLEDKSDYFVFGDGNKNAYKVFGRGEMAEAFLRKGVEVLHPLEEVKSLDCLTVSLDADMFALSYFDNEEKSGLILDEKSEPVGVIADIWNVYQMSYLWKTAIYRKDLHIEFYERIINNIEEEIFITDEYGFVQFLNPYAEKVCGVTLKEVVGCHVEDMEKRGIISSSITKEVFKHKTTQNKLMEMHTGHTVIATGIPLYDKDGKLINVLASSKDIAELRNILAQLQDVTTELGQKEKQITELKKKIITQDNYVLESQAMQDVQKSILKIAPTDATVLIDGESGVGKEVAAELLYKSGNRADRPFTKINCGMIPEHLLESEFFGYEPGAFTGANKTRKKGKIETANGGTLFFDEIGEMPLALQVKILEFLQDKEIVRVGGMKRIPIDVRIIAATNRDLKAMVKEGSFRSDLYYRLDVMAIHVSPLRERPEDIMPLTAMFLQKYNARYGKTKTFDPSVLSYFLEYSWPGNVRELMHTVERLLIISDDDMITMAAVDKVLYDNDKKITEVHKTSLKNAKQELEFSMVKRAYEIFHSSYKVAEVLGVTQPAVMKILKRNGYHLQYGVLVKI